MSYPPSSTPGAPSTSWTTPERPGTMPVSALVATDETPETPDPIVSPDDVPDVKADIVSATVVGAVAAVEARYHSHQADTYGQGSQLGTVLNLPEVPDAHSKHIGGDGAGYPA